MAEVIMWCLTGLVLIGLVLFMLNAIYIRTQYYQNQIRYIKKFQDGVPYNLDIMNTGSNHALFSIDWSLVNVNGFSLASGPQSISWDYRLVKKYGSHIKRKGVLLIALSDLVFGFLDYPHDSANRRYYYFMDRDSIPNYSAWKSIKYRYLPIMESWRNFIRCIYRRGNLIKDHVATLEYAEEQSDLRIKGWKMDFELSDLQRRESAAHLQTQIQEAVQILRKIIVCAAENNLRPMIVIPPLSSIINKKISDEFLKAVLYEPLYTIAEDIPVLDYMRDARFQDYRLYQNGDFMNSVGRKSFMPILIQDIRKHLGDTVI
mgnify:FL=1